MSAPRVTIGIPTLNGPERLRRCLASIAATTNRVRHGIAAALVVDDGSTEENYAQNLQIANSFDFEMLPPQGRRGIAAGWNRLSRHTDVDVVAILNDDVEVEHDWIDVLTYSVWENPSIGMVSLNCFTNVTREQVGHRPRRAYARAQLDDGGGTLLASGGACFAFRHDVFEEVGGFDERYFVYYEEVDFGVSLRKRGYRHYIANHPTVYHLVGATNRDQRNLDAEEQLLRSRALFREKWGRAPNELRQDFAAAPAKDAENLREWNTSLRDLTE